MDAGLSDIGSGNGSIILANLSNFDDQLALSTDRSDNVSNTIITSSNSVIIYFTFGILMSTIGMTGVVGNILSIVVLSNSKMKSSINCCLIGLAIFDSVLILAALPIYSVANICGIKENSCPMYFNLLFPYIIRYVYPLAMIAQTGSVWVTVAVTVERYIAVCLPLRARSMCTYGRSRVCMVVITVFSISYNLPRFWELELYQMMDPDSGLMTVSARLSWLRLNKFYTDIYYTWMYLIVMYLVPLVMLAGLNGLIWINIREANRNRQQLSGQQQTERRLTIMLFCLVAVFFICNMPAIIYRFLLLKDIIYVELIEFSNLLIIINSSVNFVIYCIFGQMFRRILMRMMCSCCPRGLGVGHVEGSRTSFTTDQQQISQIDD